MKSEYNNIEVDLSSADNVFCDSVDAINWAYDAGLNTKSIIKTNSPALAWEKNKNVFRLDSKWDINQMKQFQSTIGDLSKAVFDSVKTINGVFHEEALCVSMVTVEFQRLLFKASCLTRDDVSNPVLFIRVEGDGGPNGNNMNPPWDRIFKDNKKFNIITYQQEKEWNVLNTESVPWYRKIRVAGVETLIYRILLKITNFLPKNLFKKKVFVYRENELVIEVATKLALRGVKINSIRSGKKSKLEKSDSFFLIKNKIDSIIRKRVKDWVIPEIASRCEQIFFENLEKRINLFFENRAKWNEAVDQIRVEKGVLLTNHPSGVQGYAITSLCREKKVPVITAQHGVTPEISKYYDEIEYGSDPNTCDCYLAYNETSANIAQNSHFSIGKSFVAGISLRHLRMSSTGRAANKIFPLVYISTNIYKGNLGPFISALTDYDRSIKEKELIEKVFSRLSYNVRYKTYPEDNRRYPDVDPVFNIVDCLPNVELFIDKVDMRYLYGEHRIVMTSRATSTLGWAIMSKKPVVFINWKENSPLTSEAESFFEKGLFLFNDDECDFHERLRYFLSKPIFEIERLWGLKKKDRQDMVNHLFSAYSSDAGKRSARMIINNFLT
jgi:hypothetical protein